ncbi:efflux RND transporter periplasmic adaptor subunit [Chitinivorax sp. B]|uniref:efflux RND transporter periplasmic adaptor subunit n=1 Tax=Chitinivorax sp. B TaxID=2502235 RepID=UPI001485450F|nr:efflux RND transporter periplasmic adaptor subunit [Chitinivorax sp. B]
MNASLFSHALLGSLLLFPLPIKAASPSGKAVPVRTAVVQSGQIAQALTAIGSLRANESVVLRPEVAGRITQIHFREGQQVKRGALLFSLDASEQEAQLKATQVDGELAKDRLKRLQSLKQDNYVSQQALDEQQSSDQQARAKIALDRARLAKTRIAAPFDGVLGLRQVSPGAYVQPGQELVKLEDDSVLKVDFRVPEAFINQLGAGKAIQIVVDAAPGQEFTGSISAFDTTVDEKTRSLLVRASTLNITGQLKPGMFARIRIPLARPMAVIVPEQAIVAKGGSSLVFRVVDGKAVPAKVTLGNRRPGEVEVTQGLKAGERVVVEGQIKLQPGAAVTEADTAPVKKS